MTLTVEPNFTIGGRGPADAQGHLQGRRHARPRVHLHGQPLLGHRPRWSDKGKVAPRPVRLADAREFPVRMAERRAGGRLDRAGQDAGAQGLQADRASPCPRTATSRCRSSTPTARWSASSSTASSATKGPHEVKWDGLTTHELAHAGRAGAAGHLHLAGDLAQGDRPASARLGLQRRQRAVGQRPARRTGAAITACRSPAPPTGDQVYLGWSGAEAGKALLACDLQGNVLWKNSRQGMAGAEFVGRRRQPGLCGQLGTGAARTTSIACSADTGAYAEWRGGTPDLFLKDILPDVAQQAQPHRRAGRRRRQAVPQPASRRDFAASTCRDWRSLLKKLKAGEGLARPSWKQAGRGEHDSGRRRWLDGNQPEDEALRRRTTTRPTCATPSLEALNGLLADKSLPAGRQPLARRPGRWRTAGRWKRPTPARWSSSSTELVAVVDAEDPEAAPRLARAAAAPPLRGRRQAGLRGLRTERRCWRSIRPAGTHADGHQRPAQRHRRGRRQARDSIYVAVREPENQVKVFSAGRQAAARDRPARRAPPAGPLAARRHGLCRRASPWTPRASSGWPRPTCARSGSASGTRKTGQFVKEFFGPTHLRGRWAGPSIRSTRT